MTEEEERIVRTLERGEATPEEQKQAARILRDYENSLRELSELNQRG